MTVGSALRMQRRRGRTPTQPTTLADNYGIIQFSMNNSQFSPKYLFLCLPLLLYLSACHQTSESSCLPEAIQLTDVVSATLQGDNLVKTVTVSEKLKELQAACQNGKLVDSLGKEIRFYQLQGCWGTPPPNYSEIMQTQAEELSALEKQYTVITMTCNPGGIPYP